jgi:hypothetical protein
MLEFAMLSRFGFHSATIKVIKDLEKESRLRGAPNNRKCTKIFREKLIVDLGDDVVLAAHSNTILKEANDCDIK